MAAGPPPLRWDGNERRGDAGAQYIARLSELGALIATYDKDLREHRTEVLTRLDGIDGKMQTINTYPEDHSTFIAVLLAREQRRQERSERIKAQVGGWAVMAFIGGIGTAAWFLFKMALNYISGGGKVG